jgi:prepilin-type N-terminal cleavage/methylation domain-containing protein
MRRRFRRGFTLIEMMIVVVVIGLFAALAAPSVITLVRDQRARREAISVVDIFRDARARSLGRGSAVNINYQNPGAIEVTDPNQADFIMREAFDAVTSLPDPYCTQHAWLAADSNLLAWVRPAPSPQGTGVSVQGTIFNASAVAVPSQNFNVCFAPSGRVFVQNLAVGGAWQPLDGYTMITMQRMDGTTPTGLIRTIQMNADGVTKIQL